MRNLRNRERGKAQIFPSSYLISVLCSGLLSLHMHISNRYNLSLYDVSVCIIFHPVFLNLSDYKIVIKNRVP